jgi:hypothetical protein
MCYDIKTSLETQLKRAKRFNDEQVIREIEEKLLPCCIQVSNAANGKSGMVNGITYTKRTRGQITETNTSATFRSGITDMQSLFASSKFNQGIGSWDVSNLTDTQFMFASFASTSSFNQDIGNWDVNNVINMQWIFWLAEALNHDIGN